jgi:ribokinase
VIRFVAVGDLMVDVTAAGRGHDARIAVAAGGTALNAACRAAGLGARTAVAGRIGDDAGGRLLLAHLAAHGVRARVGIDGDAPTGTLLVVDGEIRADRGANARYLPEHLPQLEADVVLVSGHLPEATAAAALARADAPWVALDAARVTELPAGAPVVLANEAAARRLTGAGAEEAARRLAAGRRLACVTLAGAGAVAAWDGQVYRAPAPRAGTDDDVPGAGDAFAATLLCGLARGASVPEALAQACDAGAGVARAAGAAAAVAAR